MIKEYNAYEEYAVNVTSGLKKVLFEAVQQDSKIKFSQLTCENVDENLLISKNYRCFGKEKGNG